jgi:hypothetical protein
MVRTMSCKNSGIVRLRAKALLALMVLATVPLRADDGAASIAAGGVVVMKREPRITMAKEVLRISESKVIVDYDFRNDSDQDITTEVAFPIPDYDHDLQREAREPTLRRLDDFQLWIDGVATSYAVESRAFLKDTEYTSLLTGMHVDIASFGHAPEADRSPEIQRLPPAQLEQVQKLGLIDRDGEPLWKVKKKYYWQQTFPAHKIVHIRHEYTPIAGATNNTSYGMGPEPDPYAVKELKTFCIDGALQGILQNVANSNPQGRNRGKAAPYTYVDFILTTANTWKTPIEDFTLIVERSHWKGSGSAGDYVSFCWDGPVTKTDAEHFSAHVSNLVPTKELRIGFFHVLE